MVDFKVDDPVKVKGDLEGIVAWMDGETVGVRLTGKSVGKGNTDGTALDTTGVRHFECPAKSGLFCTVADLEKRALTRLEELQIKRELATSRTSGGTSSITPRRSATGVTTKTTAASAASSSSSGTAAATAGSRSPTAAGSAKDRLESIRKRREALIKSKQQPPAADGTATAAPGDEPPTAAHASSKTPAASSTSTTTFSSGMDTTVSASSNSKVIEEQQQLLLEGQQLVRDKMVENRQLQQRVVVLEQQLVQQQLSLSIPPTTPTKARLSQTLEQSQQEALQLQTQNATYRDTIDDLTVSQHQLQTQVKVLTDRETTAVTDLLQARVEVTSLQNQLTELVGQHDQRGTADAIHYKERAKLQAQVAACQRQLDDMVHQKLDLEAAMGELALDKEHLTEQLEELQEKAEEWKLDAETAQMELEELKVEMEHKSLPPVIGNPSGGTGGESDYQQLSDEQVRVQNGRLREALIRLREQSTLDRLELTRQLKTLEKQATENRADATLMQDLQNDKKRCLEEINELKDMVEQGSAFEGMVEDLSDRLMAMEEDTIALRSTIRELEEAAELATELEEVQADELRALASDLEARDTMIRNLEEAIRLQRRREEDFKRTTTNYRNAVDTLKQEKQALLEMQTSSDSQTKASQKALSRAAQWVADAARMRKRDAVAALTASERSFYDHLSSRLESLLPTNIAYNEITAIKGELIAGSAISKAAASLEGIQQSMLKAIVPQVEVVVANTSVEFSPLPAFSEDEKQAILLSFHQADFADVLVEASSQCLRCLAAGQWPDLLSPDLSIELGAVFGHTIPEMDAALASVLRTIKEEDGLSIEQSNMGELQLTVTTSLQNMKNEMEREDGLIVPSDWNPPAWKLFRDACKAKLRCMAVAAAMSGVMGRNETSLGKLYNKLEQCASQASSAFSKLSLLDVQGAKFVNELTGLYDTLSQDSEALLAATREFLNTSGGNDTFQGCQNAADAMLRSLSKSLTILRAENLNADGTHALSPECKDPWAGLLQLSKDVQSTNGDPDDVNGLLRARNIEQSLSDAVEKVPLLEISNVKVAHLEKVRAFPAFSSASLIFPIILLSDFVDPIQGNCDAKCKNVRIGKATRQIQFCTYRPQQQSCRPFFFG
jgi:dynactin 1